jgi:hypothetical protein
MYQFKGITNWRILERSQPAGLTVGEALDVVAQHIHDECIGEPGNHCFGAGSRMIHLVGDQPTMNKARWAALANFFFPDAGYLIAGSNGTSRSFGSPER